MVESSAEDRLLHNAQAAGADAVCIRTTNARLPGAIDRFHSNNIKVYAWRWPAVRQSQGDSTHHYAVDEATYVVQRLIPAGLDGYIVDPESEPNRAIDDWNDPSLAPLARSFCQTIKAGAAAAGVDQFRFGVTSGCNYPSHTGKPNIPWTEFIGASDAVYPQTYWRATVGRGETIDINGGTPNAAITRGKTAWSAVARGKPIIYMAGELDLITPAEITAYGMRAQAEGVTEFHFYADNVNVPSANYQIIRGLGAPIVPGAPQAGAATTTPVDVSALISLFNQLQRRGVKYLYGGKANDKSTNRRSNGRLSTPPDTIDGLDCSGFTRYALYQTAAGLDIRDGSENQLEWFQGGSFRQLESYSDVNEDIGRSALYIAFIKAHVNGCGPIGHVWLVYKRTDGVAAETFECHGGGGLDSRPWNTATLFHEEYMAFELSIG
jgi:hypothetical protein